MPITSIRGGSSSEACGVVQSPLGLITAKVSTPASVVCCPLLEPVFQRVPDAGPPGAEQPAATIETIQVAPIGQCRSVRLTMCVTSPLNLAGAP